MQFIAILQLIFKFWDEVTLFVKKIEGTPAENREKILAKIHAAFEKSEAVETKNDTSSIEDVIAS